MPGGVRQILLIDPDRLGDHALVGAPGQAPQPDLVLEPIFEADLQPRPGHCECNRDLA